MLSLASLGAAITLNRYITLNIKIYYASRSLVKAFVTEHQGLWGKAMEDPLIIRSMYFENADSEIAKLVEVHNKTHLLLKSLYNVCGFESTLNRFFTKSR